MLHLNRPGWHVFTCLGCRWERGQKMFDCRLHTHLAWHMAEIWQVPVCPTRFFLSSLGYEGGGHEVGVEVDNCQESGSVRVQGHSGATPTSICVLYNRTPSSSFIILHWIALHTLCSASHYMHYTLEWGPTKVYKQPGQARFSLNVTEWYSQFLILLRVSLIL